MFIPTANVGSLDFQAGVFKYCDGTTWQTLGGGGGAGDFKADGSVVMSGVLRAAPGTAALPGYSFVGMTGTGMFETGTDMLGFSTAGAERMRVLANGNVGIGTTNPTRLLDLSTPTGGSNAEIRATTNDAGNFSTIELSAVGTNTLSLGQTGTASFGTGAQSSNQSFIISQASQGLGIAAATSSPIRFYTGGSNTSSERMRIDSAGNLGIGTTSPTAKLQVNNTTVGTIPMVIRAVASQTAKLSEWQNNAGAGLYGLDISGVPTATTDLATKAYVDTAVSGGGGSLTHFTENVNTAAPNATVPVVRLTATNAATNVDMALSPKGSGAITAQVADNTSTGGDKRGIYSVDWQLSRALADQVASGLATTIGGGFGNKASGDFSGVAAGFQNTASANYNFVGGGESNTATGLTSSILGGTNNSATGAYGSIVGGAGNIAVGALSSVGGGIDNEATGSRSTVAGGEHNHATGSFSMASNYYTTADSYAKSTFGAYNLPVGSENPTSWVSTDPLFVIGNGTGSGASRSNAVMVLKNGNVGIGSAAPWAKLLVDTAASGSGVYVTGTVAPVSGIGNGTYWLEYGVATNVSHYSLPARAGDAIIRARGASSNGNLILSTQNATGGVLITTGSDFSNDTVKLAVLNNGNVGIGATAPTEKLEVSGNVRASHIIGAGAAPSVAAYSGAGSGASISLVRATDMSGKIDIVPTGSGPDTGMIAQITFGTAYGAAPNCTITAAHTNSAQHIARVYVITSTTALSLMNAGTPLSATSAYSWFYSCVQ